jgi:hypothetical protein
MPVPELLRFSASSRCPAKKCRWIFRSTCTLRSERRDVHRGESARRGLLPPTARRDETDRCRIETSDTPGLVTSLMAVECGDAGEVAEASHAAAFVGTDREASLGSGRIAGVG